MLQFDQLLVTVFSLDSHYISLQTLTKHSCWELHILNFKKSKDCDFALAAMLRNAIEMNVLGNIYPNQICTRISGKIWKR